LRHFHIRQVKVLLKDVPYRGLFFKRTFGIRLHYLDQQNGNSQLQSVLWATRVNAWRDEG
jgi:hypothetical protein